MMINICGIPYTVREVPHHFTMGEIHLGEIDYMSCEILINDSLPGDLKREVLCHEIVHGILHHLGYEEENDEKIVQQLGNAINQTFDVKDLGPKQPKGEMDDYWAVILDEKRKKLLANGYTKHDETVMALEYASKRLKGE